MAVWGIGAYYFDDKEDQTLNFIENGTAYIGYLEEDKPELYKLFREASAGDIIVLKARYPIKKPVMREKAIGMITNAELCLQNGLGNKAEVEVNWFCDFHNAPEKIVLNEENNQHNLTHTVFKITNDKLINDIAEILKKHQVVIPSISD